MTAVVGSAAEDSEDTTPSEREAPARFAWWHPQSADLGRRAEARRQHARRNDLWARPTACDDRVLKRSSNGCRARHAVGLRTVAVSI